MKIKTIEWWNSLTKDNDTDVTAIEGDNALLVDGIAFLIQRKNNWNNVVCIRINKSDKSIIHTFCTVRAWCQRQKIQYLRIEGIGKHTYRMLNLLYKYSPDGAGLIYRESESVELGRHVHYVKTY